MDDWTSGPVLRHLDDGILIVTLNLPEQGNAWSWELEQHYFDSLEQAAGCRAVRVIVVTGAGRSFCVGADMNTVDDELDAGPGAR